MQTITTTLNAASLREIQDRGDSVVKSAAWLSVKEGDEVLLKSSDGQMFSAYVYGFEKTRAGRLVMFDLN